MKLSIEFDPDFAATPRPKCRRIHICRTRTPLRAPGRARAGTREYESSAGLADHCGGPRPGTCASSLAVREPESAVSVRLMPAPGTISSGWPAQQLIPAWFTPHLRGLTKRW